MTKSISSTRSNIARNLDQVIFGSMLIMIFFIPISEALKNIFFVSAVVFWIAKIMATKEYRIRIPFIGWFLLAFLGVVFLSAMNSDCRFTKGIGDVLIYTLFFLLIVNTIESEAKVLTLLWTAIISIGIGDLLGLYDYFLSGKEMIRLSIRSLGFTGAYLVMILSLLLGLLLHIRFNKKQQLLIITVLILSWIALVFTYTRSMWVIFLLITLLFAILRKAWKWPIIISVAFLTLLFIGKTINLTIHDRINELKNPLKAPSLLARVPIWQGAFRMFQDHPFLGVGPKCFKLSREKYKVPDDAGQAHNIIFHVASELGMVGLTALIAWLSAYLYFLIKLKNRLMNNLAKALWYASIGSYLTILIGGIVDPTFGHEVSLIFMMITGLLIVSNNLRAEGEEVYADCHRC